MGALSSASFEPNNKAVINADASWHYSFYLLSKNRPNLEATFMCLHRKLGQSDCWMKISNSQVCRSKNPERAHIRSEIFLEGIDEAWNLEETIIRCVTRAIACLQRRHTHTFVTKRLSEIVSEKVCSLLFTNRCSSIDCVLLLCMFYLLLLFFSPLF